MLPEFRAQFPQVQFRIEEAPSAELDRKLLEGEIDLAFYMSFARHPGLSYRVLRRDRMYAVFGKGHPLEQAAAREGSFAWEWLEGQTLLLQNQTQRQGQYILQELRSRRLHPAEILESSNIRAAAALAANGYGIGFLSGGRHFLYLLLCEQRALRRQRKRNIRAGGGCGLCVALQRPAVIYGDLA